MNRGAVILCGGRSSRMGRDKATLPFGPELMLPRLVRLVGEAVATEKIVVVAAVGQNLPPLPAGVTIVRDERPERGPLEGLAAGLRAHARRSDAVFVTACDVPLLVPAVIEALFAELGAHAAVAPLDADFPHPLSTVYRTSVLAAVEQLLAADQLRAIRVFDKVDTLKLSVERLRGRSQFVDARKPQHARRLRACSGVGRVQPVGNALRGVPNRW
ncbi:MAG: molybdenum cofactor guanylyltransferase [Pirellulales bacterium]